MYKYTYKIHDQYFLGSYEEYNHVVGLILILDHLEDPVSFLRKFIDLGINSISIIVEKIETKKGLPIQHLTGWNERSLSYLAKTLNLKIKYFNADDESYIFAVFEVWILILFKYVKKLEKIY